MMRIYGIFAALLFMTFLVSGCGSDGSSEAKSIIKNQADVTEDYVNGLADAKSAEDVVKAIKHYTEGMKRLIPELKEFQEKYPEYKQGQMPSGMEADVKRLEAVSAKIPGVMMKVTSYMMDGKVQAAMAQMGEEMGKLQ